MRGHPLWSDLAFRLHIGGSDHLVAWFAGLALFEGMPRRHLRYLSRMFHRREFEAGESIFRQGDIGSGMYLIQSGRVRILAEDHLRGETQLAILEPGQVFGEMALFDHSPRSASAVAQGGCVLYGLFEGDLDQVERARPQASARLMRNIGLSLALRLRQTNERLHDVEEGSSRGPY
jgi:CRP/FNR family transcriptional regulator, cyclic AMP receptor protein